MTTLERKRSPGGRGNHEQEQQQQEEKKDTTSLVSHHKLTSTWKLTRLKKHQQLKTHTQLKNRRWKQRAHYPSFTERDEDWTSSNILNPASPQDVTSGPCNVYKNKLSPCYLHYLTTIDADSAKKKWRSCSKQEGCKRYSGTPTQHKSHEVRFGTRLYQVRAWRKKTTTSFI